MINPLVAAVLRSPLHALMSGNTFADVTGNDPDATAQALSEFLTAVPRDASHAGVRLDGRGKPLAAVVAAAVPRLAHVVIRLSDDAPGRHP